jgi:benzoyl-CoA reductase/2-hydroxyglutaryl-CoA dehydratase subunit BcrC/BadD/HgdB
MSASTPNILAGRHARAKELKARGTKVLGYLCAYCPEEIVSAAGLAPVRVFGGPGPHPLAEGRLPDYYCAHARGCLNAGLGGDYAYLDGLVFPYTCLHTQGAYESWARQNNEMYSWFIDLPSVVDTPEAAEFAVEELKAFVSSLESAFGVSITDDDLAASIHDGNQKRALLRRIYMLKSEPRPIVSGAEVFSLILESMTGGMGTEELSGLVADLESRENPREDRTRVMVLGTDLDDPRIFAAIEVGGHCQALPAGDQLPAETSPGSLVGPDRRDGGPVPGGKSRVHLAAGLRPHGLDRSGYPQDAGS